MKERDKMRARDLNDREIRNMPERSFKVMVINVVNWSISVRRSREIKEFQKR